MSTFAMGIAAPDYRPHHSWDAVRLNTTRGQLAARLAVVDAVGSPEPNYEGRHRDWLGRDVECGYGHTMPLSDLYDHECSGLMSARARGLALIERIQASS